MTYHEKRLGVAMIDKEELDTIIDNLGDYIVAEAEARLPTITPHKLSLEYQRASQKLQTIIDKAPYHEIISQCKHSEIYAGYCYFFNKKIAQTSVAIPLTTLNIPEDYTYTGKHQNKLQQDLSGHLWLLHTKDNTATKKYQPVSCPPPRDFLGEFLKCIVVITLLAYLCWSLGLYLLMYAGAALLGFGTLQTIYHETYDSCYINRAPEERTDEDVPMNLVPVV